MTLDEAHRIILNYEATAGSPADWTAAIERIRRARQDAAFDAAYDEAHEKEGTVSRSNAKYYFVKGVEYATGLLHD
jgi:hypothetical protein